MFSPRLHHPRAQDVAVNYINTGKGLPILFECHVGAIDRGCPLSFMSQFPGEDEILIPAMSFIEVTGSPSTMDTLNKGPVTVYPAHINCNLKALTIDQIEERRRDELLAQHPYIVAEFDRDVQAIQDQLERKNRSKWEVSNIAQAGKTALKEQGKAFLAKGPAWYHLAFFCSCPSLGQQHLSQLRGSQLPGVVHCGAGAACLYLKCDCSQVQRRRKLYTVGV